jgi:flagellar motor switch protein FliG
MGKVKVPGGGVEQAAKLLQSLSLEERDKILQEMKTKDPELAAQVERHLIGFIDLTYMTPKMLQEFFKRIKLDQLG